MENALGEFQHILLLGGRSEIGVAIAVQAASPFTRTVRLAGRHLSSADVDSVTTALRSRGLADVDVVTVPFDAVDVGAQRAFFESFGGDRIDLAIFAFGVLGDQQDMLHNPERAAEVLEVNTTGMVTAGLACAHVMKQQGHGQMLFVSSVAGVRPRKANFVYGASKAGMDAFAQGLSDELVEHNVGVTIVRPGFVKTVMTQGLQPAPFATTAEVVAVKSIEGLRSGRRIVWVPGILRIVFGIFRLLPTFVWRRLPIN